MLVSPPIPRNVSNITESKSGFQSGDGFIAERIDQNIVVWGGYSSGIDPNIVHIYNINTKSWTYVTATGNIHPGVRYAVSVVFNDVIYIFGGEDSKWKMTNHVSILDATGRFVQVAVVGNLPLPLYRAVGWTYNNHIYFGFGMLTTKRARTNEIWKFDPMEKSFSQLSTSGSPPEPRVLCAVARLGSKVYVHSGYGRNDRLNDFFQLDLQTLQWSKISEVGLSHATDGHSLSVISPSQLLLVGGLDSNLTMIFNADNSSWAEDERLPAEFGNYLSGHKAVEVRKDGRVVKVICLGGSHRAGYSKYILEFDIEAARHSSAGP